MFTFIFYYLPAIIVAIAMINELVFDKSVNTREDYMAATAGTFIPVFNIYVAYQVVKEWAKG